MKLRLVVQDDQVERVTLSLHSGVLSQLRVYKAFYESVLGGKVQQNNLIEEMLKSCMTEDKDFIKYLKTHREQPAKPKSVSEPDDALPENADDSGDVPDLPGNADPSTSSLDVH